MKVFVDQRRKQRKYGSVAMIIPRGFLIFWPLWWRKFRSASSSDAAHFVRVITSKAAVSIGSNRSNTMTVESVVEIIQFEHVAAQHGSGRCYSEAIRRFRFQHSQALMSPRSRNCLGRALDTEQKVAVRPEVSPMRSVSARSLTYSSGSWFTFQMLYRLRGILDEFDTAWLRRSAFAENHSVSPTLDVGFAVSAFAVVHRHLHNS